MSLAILSKRTVALNNDLMTFYQHWSCNKKYVQPGHHWRPLVVLLTIDSNNAKCPEKESAALFLDKLHAAIPKL